jgi:ubiquinone/menaquinone biosynthesis C-methylase UbiE
VNDYDRIARVYGPIKKLVFQNRLARATSHHLDLIEKGEKILILGGGSGEILNLMPLNVDITYLEKSKAMIHLARKYSRSYMTFVQQDFLQYDESELFEWVVCPFFLDVFDLEHLKKVLEKIASLVSKEGKLIVIDFNSGNWFQNIFIRSMYLFFRITTNIQTKKLLDIHQNVLDLGFEQNKKQLFSNGLIFSRIYSKRETFI